MVGDLLFLCILFSGSALGAARFRMRTENTLPITVMSIVLLLFIFGLCGQLRLGVYAVILAAIGCYAVVAFCVVSKKTQGDWKQFAGNFFTCGLSVFLIFAAVTFVLDHGRVASFMDEFSHWMDIVKAMVYVDDFGTNPAAQSLFQSYPPGMALFQYFHQKINALANPAVVFQEWSTYWDYQLFFAAVCLPFFDGLSMRHPVSVILMAAVLFLLPTVFFTAMYSCLLIDPMLGILAGSGMAYVFVRKALNWKDYLYLCMLSAMLVLMKDVGLLLAVFLAMMCCVRTVQKDAILLRKKTILIVLILLLPLLVKGLWSMELELSTAKVSFDGKVDLAEFIRILVNGEDSYRKEVIANYLNALSTSELAIGPIQVKYLRLILAAAVASYILWSILQKRGKALPYQKWCLILAFVQTVVYVAGMCLMYMFKFSEYEAVHLAALDRYLYIVLSAQWLYLALITVHLIWDSADGIQIKEGILLLCLVMCIHMDGLYYTLQGSKEKAAWDRSFYTELVSQINEVCDSESRICVISQEDNGRDSLVYRFVCRPNSFSMSFMSIGESFYEGDIWTRAISPTQWQEELLESYDYVGLHKLNPYFYENYVALFAEPDEIAESRLYKVNKNNGLLELCAPW